MFITNLRPAAWLEETAGRLERVNRMTEKKSILVRLNPKLWDEINRWAEQEFRSVNGQIEYLLNEAVIRRKKAQESTGKDSGGKTGG